MDPVTLLELYEKNPEWTIMPLEGERGIFIGHYADFLKLISNINLSEDYG